MKRVLTGSFHSCPGTNIAVLEWDDLLIWTASARHPACRNNVARSLEERHPRKSLTRVSPNASTGILKRVVQLHGADRSEAPALRRVPGRVGAWGLQAPGASG